MRVNVYVDGFNLYHRALRNARAPDGSTYKWLDLEKLAAQVLSNPDYAIGRIRYFTARVRALPGDPRHRCASRCTCERWQHYRG